MLEGVRRYTTGITHTARMTRHNLEQSIDGIICYSQRYQIYYGPIIDIIANVIVFII